MYTGHWQFPSHFDVMALGMLVTICLQHYFWNHKIRSQNWMTTYAEKWTSQGN